MLLWAHDIGDETKLTGWDKTYKCKTSDAGAWFIGIGFSKFHDFSMIWMIFQSSMTFHDFAGKFHFSRFSRPCGNPDLEIRQMTLKNNRAPSLCYFKLCASLCSHMWFQTGVTVQKCLIWVKIKIKIDNFFVPCDLEIGQMTLKNNRAPLLCHIKLCASFHHHMWIQTGVTVRKRDKLGHLCDLDLRPLTLTFCMDITLVNGNHCWKFHDDTMTGTLSTRPTLERR